jgi:hypothetical protein
MACAFNLSDEIAERQGGRHHHPAGKVVAVDEGTERVGSVPCQWSPEPVDEAVAAFTTDDTEQRERDREEKNVPRQRSHR